MSIRLKSLIAPALAAATLVSVTMASTTPAEAWCRWHRCGWGWGWGFGGFATGLFLGSALAAPYYYAPPPAYYYGPPPYYYYGPGPCWRRDYYGRWYRVC